MSVRPEWRQIEGLPQCELNQGRHHIDARRNLPFHAGDLMHNPSANFQKVISKRGQKGREIRFFLPPQVTYLWFPFSISSHKAWMNHEPLFTLRTAACPRMVAQNVSRSAVTGPSTGPSVLLPSTPIGFFTTGKKPVYDSTKGFRLVGHLSIRTTTYKMTDGQPIETLYRRTIEAWNRGFTDEIN